MTPTVRAAAVLAGIALAAILLPLWVSALAAVVLLGAVAADAWTARRRPVAVERELPAVASRGVPVELRARVRAPWASAIALRQPAPPDLRLEPAGAATDSLTTALTARRRGRHVLPPLGVRVHGPLGLGAAHHDLGGELALTVLPDVAAARRLALAVRRGRGRDPGASARGPLGLGTDFESIREYRPDDDVRQVNWRATARLGTPMSNQYRVDQDRDVLLVVDTGRLMAAPLTGPSGAPDRSGLDAALDAAAAVALVADEVGDRCGTIAFADDVRAALAPRRGGGDAVIRALAPLQPVAAESDYERAFRRAGGGKRAYVLVLTDLLDEAAARALVAAVPVLARRHAVVVASPLDPAVEQLVRVPPDEPRQAYRLAAAVDVLAARARAAALVRAAGAGIVEAPPAGFAAACVRAYLRAKARGAI